MSLELDISSLFKEAREARAELYANALRGDGSVPGAVEDRWARAAKTLAAALLDKESPYSGSLLEMRNRTIFSATYQQNSYTYGAQFSFHAVPESSDVEATLSFDRRTFNMEVVVARGEVLPVALLVNGEPRATRFETRGRWGSGWVNYRLDPPIEISTGSVVKLRFGSGSGTSWNDSVQAFGHFVAAATKEKP